MKKKGYSYRGFFGQRKYFDNDGNFKGESYRNFLGGRTHTDADHNVTGYSYSNFWGGYTRYDKDMNKIGYSYRNFWGGLNYFDPDMNKTGSSYHNMLNGMNYYSNDDNPAKKTYPLAGTNYSNAKINSNTKKASFVSYDEGVTSDDTYDDLMNVLSNNKNEATKNKVDPFDSKNDSRDLWGLDLIKGKTCEEILLVLKTTKNVMDELYDYLSEDSRFRTELFDNRQMLKDLWLHTIYEQVGNGKFNDSQKIQVCEILLEGLGVNNDTSVEKHMNLMNSQCEYNNYIMDCFSCKDGGHGVFWTFLSHMGSVYDFEIDKKTEEHVPHIMNFAIGYLRFFVQLEAYLKKMFAGYGFGENVKMRLLKKMDRISETFDYPIDTANVVFLNPLYDIWYDGKDED